MQLGSLAAPVTVSDSGGTGIDALTVLAGPQDSAVTIVGDEVTAGAQNIVLEGGLDALAVDGGGNEVVVVVVQPPPIPLAVEGVADVVLHGTSGNDTMLFTPGSKPGEIRAWLNDVLQGTFTPTGRILAYGEEGDDDIQVAGSIGLPAWIYGGDGNDRIKGGSGHDVLFGEAGDDLLQGNSGRDFLLGDDGADRIIGNADDDIIIGGRLNFADRDAAVAAIMDEWISTRLYAERTANIRRAGTGERKNGFYYLLADETVLDDNAKDTLTGSSGEDWFFANYQDGGVSDKITDLSATEYAADLDWINRVL